MKIVIETNDANVVEINGKMYANLIGLYECTPLPKGHGRLVDADALEYALGASDRDIYVKCCLDEDAPTIIGADREVDDADSN